VLRPYIADAGRVNAFSVGLPTDSRGRVIGRGPNAPSLLTRALLGTEVIDEEKIDGGTLTTVVGVSAIVLNPVRGFGVTPKMDDSLGAFLARLGAGVAPPVPLTPSFRLI
jgi:hypothetical protein